MCGDDSGSIGFYHPLVIKQGSDFVEEFELRNETTGELEDFTGWTARAQLRKRGLSTTKIADFACSFPELGVLRVQLTDTITLKCGEQLYEPASEYQWDCELVDPDGLVSPGCYGPANVFREVTR